MLVAEDVDILICFFVTGWVVKKMFMIFAGEKMCLNQLHLLSKEFFFEVWNGRICDF